MSASPPGTPKSGNASPRATPGFGLGGNTPQSSGASFKSLKSQGTLKSTITYSAEFNPERSKLEKDILKQEKKARDVLRQFALAADDKLIDREILKTVIAESQRRFTGCLMVPLTMMFFVFFSIAASLHEDVTAGHLLEAPVRARLTPFLGEDEEPTAEMLQGVFDIDGIYHFLEQTYLPLVLNQANDLGVELPEDQWGRIQRYNQMKGLVIMELQRSKKERCKAKIASNLWCYPAADLSDDDFGEPLDTLAAGAGDSGYYLQLAAGSNQTVLECDTEGFSVEGCTAQARRLKMMPDTPTMKGKVPLPGGSEFTYRFTLDPQAPSELSMKRFKYLRERQWLDLQSNQLVIKAYYFNYQMRVPRLQSFKVTFGFSRGGGVLSSVAFVGCPLETFVSTGCVVFDVLFLMLVLMLTIIQVKRLQKACATRAWKMYLTFNTFISWLSIATGSIVVFLIIGSVSYRSAIKEALKIYDADPSEENADNVGKRADMFGDYMSFVRLCIVAAHLLFMVQCFMTLKWQPRLAVVTRTINTMSSDLLHFMIVLIPTFIAFAIAGMMMFGRRLADFASLESALATCFKITMENEFKWRELSGQDFFTSLLWVWVYIPLVVLIMLNMVLAIIMDVYQEVHREVGHTMTMWTHLYLLYNRFKLRREWVSHTALYQAAEAMPGTIAIHELKKTFPNMPGPQGDFLVSECNNKARITHRVGVDTGVTAAMVASVHVALEEMHNDITDMKKRGWMGVGFEVADGNRREAIKDILTSVAMQQHWMSLMDNGMTRLIDRIQAVEEVADEGSSGQQPAQFK